MVGKLERDCPITATSRYMRISIIEEGDCMVRITNFGKKSRLVIYGEVKPGDFDPLEDLIGIIKKKNINVEDILQERNLEHVRKDI